MTITNKCGMVELGKNNFLEGGQKQLNKYLEKDLMVQGVGIFVTTLLGGRQNNY